MDTTHGEPDWVNWSQQTWAIEELKQDAIAVGDMISADLNLLAEDLDLSSETWSTHYDKLAALEAFHHEILSMVERARHLGILKA